MNIQEGLGHAGRVVPGDVMPGRYQPGEVVMYQKPWVERFGTLREITRGKSDPGMDLSPGIGSDGISSGCTAHAIGDDNHAGCITHS